jgi:hypothetical protein
VFDPTVGIRLAFNQSSMNRELEEFLKEQSDIRIVRDWCERNGFSTQLVQEKRLLDLNRHEAYEQKQIMLSAYKPDNIGGRHITIEFLFASNNRLIKYSMYQIDPDL